MSEKHFYGTVIPVALKPYTGSSSTSWSDEIKGPNLSQEEDLAIGLGKIHSWYTNFTPWVFTIPTITSDNNGGFISNFTIDSSGNISLQTSNPNGLEGWDIGYLGNWNTNYANIIWSGTRHNMRVFDGTPFIMTPFFTPSVAHQSQSEFDIKSYAGVHFAGGAYSNQDKRTTMTDGYPEIQADIVFVKNQSLLLYRVGNDEDGYYQYFKNWKIPLLPDNVSSSDGSLTVSKTNMDFVFFDAASFQEDTPEMARWHEQYPYAITLSHTNTVTAQQTAGLYKVAYDANGHITGSTAVVKSDITALGIPGSDTDTKVTQTAISDVSTWTSYRPLVISNAAYTNSPFTPTTTTASTYITSNIFCQPSTGIIWANGRGLKPFAIRVSTERTAITLETLMSWLMTNKYIPSGVYAHIVLTTTWSYADNDYFLFTANGKNYQVSLAGITLEFTGYATAYNLGAFRLVIHTAPAKPNATVETGYEWLEVSQVIEYWCNGSATASYDPVWKIYSTRTDLGSVGSATRPVYFSNGKPTAVTQPTSGAWYSSVPMIDASGVLEAGKYIDFHATATSTNSYDYRIYVSTATAVFQASNVDSTQITLTSDGYTSLRFDTSASGKASSAAVIQAYPLTTSGEVMLMQSGGNTVIGAGEFATNAYARKDSTGTNAVGYDNLATSENEDLYLGADTDVHIISNGQNIGTYNNTTHKEWLFAANGVLTCPDYVKLAKVSSGLMLTDKTSTVYGGIWDNGSNLWIGATQTNTNHHVGGTYISTGYDSNNSIGNSSINIVVPNAANTGGTTYTAIHTGNLSLLNTTYLPLAGGTMDTSAEISIPGLATHGNLKITNSSFRFSRGTNTWARGIVVYSDSTYTTSLGSMSIYGTSGGTADDTEFRFGVSYDNYWYNLKKDRATVAAADGWYLQYAQTGYTGKAISFYPGTDGYGYGLIIGENSGGLTMVGAGESAGNLRSLITNASTTPYSTFNYSSEYLFLTSDNYVYLVAGANGLSSSAHTDWTDCKTAVFDSNGYFRPTVNNKGCIGTSSYKWAGMYATSFNGQLAGTISSGTTATTQALSDSSTKVATTRFAFDLANRSGVFYNSTTSASAATSNPWGVLATTTIRATGNTYVTSVFLITSVYSGHPGTGILYVRFSAQGSAGTISTSQAIWVSADTWVNEDSVVVTYDVNAAGTMPAYTLQTSQPSDWSTKYNTYYTYNQGIDEYVLVSGSSAPTWAANTYYTNSSQSNGVRVRVWGKCLSRYDAFHIHPLYHGTLSAQSHNDPWTYMSSSAGGAASYNGTVMSSSFRQRIRPQILLYEAASAATTTSLECTISNLFVSWQLVYVTIQDLSFGSGSNPMSINFTVPLDFIKNPKNGSGSITHSYYVGEGYNPSNASAPTTRVLVERVSDSIIKFTHGSGNRIGRIRIYGIY